MSTDTKQERLHAVKPAKVSIEQRVPFSVRDVFDEFRNRIGEIKPDAEGFRVIYVDDDGIDIATHVTSVQKAMFLLNEQARSPVLVFRVFTHEGLNESAILTSRDHKRLVGHLCDWENHRFTAIWYEGDQVKHQDFASALEARFHLLRNAELIEPY